MTTQGKSAILPTDGGFCPQHITERRKTRMKSYHEKILFLFLAFAMLLSSCASNPVDTASKNSNASGTAESSQSAAESTDLSASDTESSEAPVAEAKDRWLDMTWKSVGSWGGENITLKEELSQGLLLCSSQDLENFYNTYLEDAKDKCYFTDYDQSFFETNDLLLVSYTLGASEGDPPFILTGLLLQADGSLVLEGYHYVRVPSIDVTVNKLFFVTLPKGATSHETFVFDGLSRVRNVYQFNDFKRKANPSAEASAQVLTTLDQWNEFVEASGLPEYDEAKYFEEGKQYSAIALTIPMESEFDTLTVLRAERNADGKLVFYFSLEKGEPSEMDSPVPSQVFLFFVYKIDFLTADQIKIALE